MQTCLQSTCPATSCRVAGRKLFAGRELSQPALKSCRRREMQRCHASMGIGFSHDMQQPSNSEPKISAPVRPYGLSPRQMQALGLCNGSLSKSLEEDMEPLRAKAWYCGDEVSETNRQVTRMSGSNAGYAGRLPGKRRRGQRKPPDLPSLLLDGRIVYIGMPLVPSVTELLISELLYLNYNDPAKPVYIYFNCIGSQGEDKQALAFEADAHTILDTMRYIKPEIRTVNVGKAYGNAAMLLASGAKGMRASIPHAQIMTAPPRMNRSFGNVTDMMLKANELEYNTNIYVGFMSEFTGKDEETIRKDMNRNRYFSPEEAIDYGIIDRIVQPQEVSMMEQKSYPAPLQHNIAAQQQARAPAGASAEGGY